MGRLRFDMDLGQMTKEVKVAEKKLDRVIKGIVDYTAVEGTGYMKANAPWTDRTTAARNGLHTATEHLRDRHEITFSHTVPYGIWLEIANSGKYQIIMPSVKHEGNLLMDRLRGTLGKL